MAKRRSSSKSPKLPWLKPGSEDINWGKNVRFVRVRGATTKPGAMARAMAQRKSSAGGEVQVSGYERDSGPVKSYTRSRPKR